MDTKLAFIIFFALISLCNSKCCLPGVGRGGGYCQGRGPCNIFCCDCDRGCNADYPKFYVIKNIVKRSTTSELHALTLFSTIDKNMDDGIEMEEAKQHLLSMGYNSTDFDNNDGQWFAKMDSNKNGILERSEFDESLNH